MSLIKYNDDSQMPFGFHQGKALKGVPAGYLLLIYESLYNGKPSDDYPLSIYIHDKLDKLTRRRDKEREIKALEGNNV